MAVILYFMSSKARKMKRKIHCEDCKTYLGEIRDATLRRNIKHYCHECSSINNQFMATDTEIAAFVKAHYKDRPYDE